MPRKENMKTPEEVKKGLDCCQTVVRCDSCTYKDIGNIVAECTAALCGDALAYIQQLELSRWELFDDLSTAYYGKQMYGLNDDGTVYSRYSCDTMSFEQAVDEFRRLIADE